MEAIVTFLADGRHLVFLDEAGCRLGMDRRYARAAPGERANCTKPFHRGPNINLIGAIGVTSLRCMMTVDGTVNGDVLEAFAQDVLGPKLRKNDVVIWDNLPAHKLQRVTDIIKDRGADVLFLPPYSPDLNPIEMLWSKLKSLIRKHAPRTDRAFQRALRKAMKAISARDLRNWFKHCNVLGQPI